MCIISILSFLLLLVAVVASANTKDNECPCKSLPRPSVSAKAETARWMAHSLDWGVLSTISSRLPSLDGEEGADHPVPFGNVYSFVDGSCDNSTGNLYFYGTYMDQSFRDMKENPVVSFTLSEASLSPSCLRESLKECRISSDGDPENPVCARLVLTGTLRVLEDKAHAEYQVAKKALWERHTSMQDWPDDHEWMVAKLSVQDVWLVDYFGGASVVPVKDYMSVNLTPAHPKSLHNEEGSMDVNVEYRSVTQRV